MSGGRDIPDDIGFFGIRADLPNHFIIKNPTYKTNELDDLKRKYDLVTHIHGNDIKKLLDATITFRSQTDPQFKNERKSKSQEQILIELDSLANAIKQARAIRDAEKTHPELFKVLRDAIRYCANSIDKRMKELGENDITYKIYNDNKGKEHLKYYINKIVNRHTKKPKK